MDVRVLRYFIEIVKEGNISSAAHSLHVSQPALSRQISDLEATLGVKLFERGHRQITLTEDGYYLYERAQEITSLVDKTTYHLQSQEVISGELGIGAGESAALQPVMDVLAQILRDYPDVRINLVSGDSALIRRKVDQGNLEFGIVMGQEALGEYNTLQLPAKNNWGILMPAEHPLAKLKKIGPTNLIGQSLLTSAQARWQEVFRNWAGSSFEQYNFIGKYNLLYNAELLIRAGAGIALTYDGLANLHDYHLVFRPLTPSLSDANTLIWAQNRQLPHVGRLFLDLLQEKTSQE